MKIDKKIVIALVVFISISLFSCSHKNSDEQRQRMSRKIKTSDYTLRADYKCTTPGNDIIIYKINNWNQWFIPKSIKDYGKPEWLIKRKDIQLQEISCRSYTSIDGSYEISLPFLSSKKVYFSDTFIPHNRESQFVLID